MMSSKPSNETAKPLIAYRTAHNFDAIDFQASRFTLSYESFNKWRITFGVRLRKLRGSKSFFESPLTRVKLKFVHLHKRICLLSILHVHGVGCQRRRHGTDTSCERRREETTQFSLRLSSYHHLSLCRDSPHSLKSLRFQTQMMATIWIKIFFIHETKTGKMMWDDKILWEKNFRILWMICVLCWGLQRRQPTCFSVITWWRFCVLRNSNFVTWNLHNIEVWTYDSLILSEASGILSFYSFHSQFAWCSESRQHKWGT